MTSSPSSSDHNIGKHLHPPLQVIAVGAVDVNVLATSLSIVSAPRISAPKVSKASQVSSIMMSSRYIGINGNHVDVDDVTLPCFALPLYPGNSPLCDIRMLHTSCFTSAVSDSLHHPFESYLLQTMWVQEHGPPIITGHASINVCTAKPRDWAGEVKRFYVFFSFRFLFSPFFFLFFFCFKKPDMCECSL